MISKINAYRIAIALLFVALVLMSYGHAADRVAYGEYYLDAYLQSHTCIAKGFDKGASGGAGASGGWTP